MKKKGEVERQKFSVSLFLFSMFSTLRMHACRRTGGWKLRSEIGRDVSSQYVSGTLRQLPNSTYSHAKGIEEDRIIVNAFRNVAAHSIESLTLTFERFEEILQRALNGFFFSVEKFY